MGFQLARLSTHWGALVGQAGRTRLRMETKAKAGTRLMMMAAVGEARLVGHARWLQPDLGGQ